MIMVTWGNVTARVCDNCRNPLYQQYLIIDNYHSDPHHRHYSIQLMPNYSCMHCWESLPYAIPASTIQEFYKELSYLILTNQIYFTEVILKDFQKLYDAVLHISHRSDLY